MDVGNEHLKMLINETDKAFKLLLRDPDSADLNDKYEQAKRELNEYVLCIRKRLGDR